MKCNKCGNVINSENISFCPNCGTFLLNNDVVPVPVKKSKKKFNPVYIIIVLIWVCGIAFVYNISQEYFYFADVKDSDDIYVNTNEISNVVGETRIIYDNRYEDLNISSASDVVSYIIEDSIAQKEGCSSEILSIENEIINNYGINAVNLCEMDIDFAKEVRDVAKFIYENYPSARGNITNLTLGNVGDKSFMAAFMPIFTFITSDTSSGYPIGIKSEIILNAKFFLNPNKIHNNVVYGSNSGYFPPNATRSSTIAHEFGHYLSYVAMLNNYNVDDFLYVRTNRVDLLLEVNEDFNEGYFSYRMIKEAYDLYVGQYGSKLTFDEFRGTISEYAVAKDKNGNYIYDETIAEAFHDCYLNGNNATIASKLIVQVLNSYL